MLLLAADVPARPGANRWTGSVPVLEALRAPDTDTIEALAGPRVCSRQENTGDQVQEHDSEHAEDGRGAGCG
ncbi:hypothetical protein ACIQZB_44705 [Streptomyces sp. NPDC097727]|uniref:hypothetical protein n=1 Tax=Streptomyces sp. NPDC097727 TaxID=3366092 RepID=UPI00381C89E3